MFNYLYLIENTEIVRAVQKPNKLEALSISTFPTKHGNFKLKSIAQNRHLSLQISTHVWALGHIWWLWEAQWVWYNGLDRFIEFKIHFLRATATATCPTGTYYHPLHMQEYQKAVDQPHKGTRCFWYNFNSLSNEAHGGFSLCRSRRRRTFWEDGEFTQVLSEKGARKSFVNERNMKKAKVIRAN